jgi:hypothetical protein
MSAIIPIPNYLFPDEPFLPFPSLYTPKINHYNSYFEIIL